MKEPQSFTSSHMMGYIRHENISHDLEEPASQRVMKREIKNALRQIRKETYSTKIYILLYLVQGHTMLPGLALNSWTQ